MNTLIPIFTTIPYEISFAAIVREGKPHGRIPANNFTRIFVESKMGRYTGKSEMILQRFCKNLKDEVDELTFRKRIETGDPFLSASEVREDLARKLCVSEQSLRTWWNPCDKSGNKMGISDLIVYTEKIGSSFLIESLVSDLKTISAGHGN